MVGTNGTFSQSRDLKDIIEHHSWTLYDVSNPPEGRAHTWEELSEMAPANQYENGHNYLFIPIPKKGEALRQAYSLTGGLGPSLTINNPDDERWVSLEVMPKANGLVALFTRLFMLEDCVGLTTPKTLYLPNPDVVMIKHNRLVDTFRRYFRIVSPEEYGVTAPVSMPVMPILN